MKCASFTFVGAIASSALIALSLVGIVGCSQNTSQPAQGTGGSGSGGTIGSGGTVGTGGATTGTGGATTGTGGVTTGTGGATAGTGGVTTGTGGATAGTGGVTTGTGGKTAGTGGSTTGSGGSAGRSGNGGASAVGGTSATGAGGATTGGDGGTTGSAQGGTGGSSGGRDAGSLGGRDAGGSSATGGSGGGGGPSSGCGKTTAKPNRKTQQTMDIGGTTRYYLLNVPSNADPSTPLPLVFALHGYDMNNVALVDLYDFTAESGNKAITVLPQGEGPAPGNTSHWGDQVLKSTWTANTTNYDFIQTLRAYVEDNYCVDTSREYISGFSMGGMFTNSMACAHSDWFRGFAPVEGGGSCTNANAQPPIIIHQGTADDIVKIDSGNATRDAWVKQNGCNQTATSVYTGCQSYEGCTEPVIYCVGNWTHTVDRIARANIWKFFDSLK
jgi:polyhydroxybutyrate depolymerase